MNFILLVIQSLWLFLPIGVANMAPVLVRKYFAFMNIPVDGGVSLRGKRLFGEHKTWRGIVSATVTGGVAFLIQYYVYTLFPSAVGHISIFDYRDLPLYTGLVMGLGAIVGDLIKSFFKRQFGVPSGASWKPFDQVDYIIGGLLLVSCVVHIGWQVWVVLIIAGFFLHIVTNQIGYALKIRETKW